LTTTTSTGDPDRNLSEHDRAIVNEAFTRLVVIYPAWRNAVDGDARLWSKRYRRELALALVDAGVTSVGQIGVGIKSAYATSTDFLPNPGKFARWCKPPSIPYHREFDDSTQLTHKPTPKSEFSSRMAQLRKAAGIVSRIDRAERA